jgi:hypothetical protein
MKSSAAGKVNHSDSYTRRVLDVTVRTRMDAYDVLDALYPLIQRHGSLE